MTQALPFVPRFLGTGGQRHVRNSPVRGRIDSALSAVRAWMPELHR
jgi:hypothetical protein